MTGEVVTAILLAAKMSSIFTRPAQQSDHAFNYQHRLAGAGRANHCIVAQCKLSKLGNGA